MNFFSRHLPLFKCRTIRWLMIVCVLVAANVLFWGMHLVKPHLAGNLYSSGVILMADGTEVDFLDKLMLRADRLNYTVKVSWDGKSNTMQEAGVASRGLRGQTDVMFKDTQSFGPSVLSEGALEEEFAFNRGYMQGGHAEISLWPLSGDFQGLCYYLIYMNKVKCGGSSLSSNPPSSAALNPAKSGE